MASACLREYCRASRAVHGDLVAVPLVAVGFPRDPDPGCCCRKAGGFIGTPDDDLGVGVEELAAEPGGLGRKPRAEVRVQEPLRGEVPVLPAGVPVAESVEDPSAAAGEHDLRLLFGAALDADPRSGAEWRHRVPSWIRVREPRVFLPGGGGQPGARVRQCPGEVVPSSVRSEVVRAGAGQVIWGGTHIPGQRRRLFTGSSAGKNPAGIRCRGAF